MDEPGIVWSLNVVAIKAESVILFCRQIVIQSVSEAIPSMFTQTL